MISRKNKNNFRLEKHGRDSHFSLPSASPSFFFLFFKRQRASLFVVADTNILLVGITIKYE
jgi:hypothetical protein